MGKEGRSKVVIVLLLLVFFAYFLFSWKIPWQSPSGLQTAESNIPPVYQEQNISAQQGTEQSINLSEWFSDPEGANLTFALDTSDATLEGDVVKFTPTSAENYVLTVIVSDGENTVYKPITVLVEENPEYIAPESEPPIEESANAPPEPEPTPEPEPAPASSRDSSVERTIFVAPTIGQALLNSSDNTAVSQNNATVSQELTAFFVNVADSDGNTVQNITDWRRNGTSIALVNLPFETNISTAGGAVEDYSQFNLAATLGVGASNATFAEGKVGGAYRFDGTDDQLNLTAGMSYIEGLNAGSIEFWYKSIDTTTTYIPIYSVNDKDATTDFASLFLGDTSASWTNESVSFLHRRGGTGRLEVAVVNGNAYYKDLAWHHFVIITGNGNNSIFVDGVPHNLSYAVGSATTNEFSDINNVDTVMVGSRDLPSDEFGAGVIDEFRVYNRSLTHHEVVQLYRDGNGGNHSRTLASQEVVLGDVWSVNVTPNDGGQDGASVLSNSVVIVSTLLPTIAQVILNSTSGNNTVSENLTVYIINATDSFGPVQNITDWRRNGTSISVLNMPFETNTTSTVSGAILDYGQFKSNGTLGNGVAGKVPVWNVSGLVGGAYTFDGIDDMINITNTISINLTSSFTIGMFVKPNSFSDYQNLLFKPTTGDNAQFGIIIPETGIWSAQATTGGNTAGAQLVVGQWSYVAYTFNGTHILTYDNGSLVTSKAVTVTTNGQDLTIGADTVFGRYFNGSIDEFMIFNRTLSANELRQIYLDGNASKHVQTLVSQELVTGDGWSVNVTPNDGGQDGASVLSNEVTIVVNCLGTITSNTTLTQNVTGTANCVTVGASNVVLDCAGYTMTWNTDGGNNDAAILVADVTNVTVKNCVLFDNVNTGSLGVGINLTRTNDSVVQNNTIRTNGTNSNYGISLHSGSNRNTIINNTIFTNGTGGSNVGIYLAASSNNNITNNSITTNGTDNNMAIYLHWIISGDYRPSDNNSIENNTLRARGSAGSNYGIYFHGSSNNNVSNNNITTNGTDSNFGMFLYTVGTYSDNNRINNNTIATNGTASLNLGIRLYTARNNNITNNTITTNGTSTNYGIWAQINSNDNLYYNNSISTDGSSSDNYGIYLSETSHAQNITNNNIRTNGTTLNYGIHVVGLFSSNNHNIDNNTITTNGTGTGNYGIFTLTGSNINITRNVIRTYGTSSNIGVYLSTETNNNNLVSNNTVTATGTTNNNIGLRLDALTSSTVTRNVVRTSGTATNYGIQIGDSSSSNTIDNNNFTIAGTTNDNYGAYITSASNTLSRNTFQTDGTNSNWGIFISSSNTNVVYNNTIRTNGTGGSNYGVIISTSLRSIIDNNTIQTNGTSDNYGVFLQASANTNRVDNNTITTLGSGGNNYGVLVSASTGNNFTRNWMRLNGTGNNYGLFLTMSSNNNTLQNNTITNNGSYSYGIFLNSSSDNYVNNTILNTTEWIFQNSGNLNNFTNTTLQTGNGSIRFNGTFTINGLQNVTQNATNITNNSAYVNSSNLSFLNTTAQIIFNGITFVVPQTIVSITDDGVFAYCSSSQCTNQSYSSGVFVFNVSQFTTYSTTEQGINISLTKTDNPDPLNISNTTILNYSVIVNVTGGLAVNVTLLDFLPPEATFINSSPGNTSNNTWLIGNMTSTAFSVNITVNITPNLANGILLNNSANISYQNVSGSNFSVQVTEQTNISNSTLVCPATITQNTTLVQNLSGSASCINIGADNITLDCNGYSITWNTAGADSNYAVLAGNRTGVTAKNCILIDGNVASVRSVGINFTSTNTSTVLNNTVRTNGTTNNYGLIIQNNSFNNTLTNNTIRTNGTSFNYGIYLFSSTYNNTLHNNTIQTDGDSNFNYGIVLETLNSNNVVSNNTVSTNGTSDNYGINIFDSGSNNVVSNNTVSTNGTSNSNYGILLQLNSNNVNNNTVSTSGTSDNNGIYISSSSNNVTGNMVSTSGTSDNNGIVVGAVANNNVLNNNTIQTQGTSNTNYGIYLTSTVSGNNLTGNVITTNGTNNNHGIRLQTSANNNTFNNNFVTTLSSLSYGISLLRSSDNRFNGTTLNFTKEWIHSGVGMLNNFSNTTFQTGNGSINSTPLWTLTGLQNITQVRLNITNNSAFSNSTNLTMINTTAQIIFNGLTSINPQFIVDFEDDGTYENCSSVQCSKQSYASGRLVFNVTRFTTYSTTESGINVSLTKTDSADPVTVGDTFTYAITVVVNESTATNTTLVESYPSQVTYVSSQPSPVSGSSNQNFSLENLTNTTFIVNITVTASTAGTATNNATLFYLNATNQSLNASVVETTTITAALGGGGGGAGIGGAGIISSAEEIKGRGNVSEFEQPLQEQPAPTEPTDTEDRRGSGFKPVLENETVGVGLEYGAFMENVSVISPISKLISEHKGIVLTGKFLLLIFLLVLLVFLGIITYRRLKKFLRKHHVRFLAGIKNAKPVPNKVPSLAPADELKKRLNKVHVQSRVISRQVHHLAKAVSLDKLSRPVMSQLEVKELLEPKIVLENITLANKVNALKSSAQSLKDSVTLDKLSRPVMSQLEVKELLEPKIVPEHVALTNKVNALKSVAKSLRKQLAHNSVGAIGQPPQASVKESAETQKVKDVPNLLIPISPVPLGEMTRKVNSIESEAKEIAHALNELKTTKGNGRKKENL